MSRVQTRKSVSISGRTYTKFREFCVLRGKTMSGVTEELLTALLDGRIKLVGGLAAMMVEGMGQPLFPKDDAPKANPSGPGYDPATVAHRRNNDHRQF